MRLGNAIPTVAGPVSTDGITGGAQGAGRPFSWSWGAFPESRTIPVPSPVRCQELPYVLLCCDRASRTAVFCHSGVCRQFRLRCKNGRDRSRSERPERSDARNLAVSGGGRTGQEPQGDIDVFAFKQGYSTPAKVSRALVHGAADVATAGLWEVVGTPIESSLQGEDVRAEVTYDTNDLVNRVEYYSGAHLANGGPALASWMRGSSTRQTAVIGTESVPQQETGTALVGAGEVGAGEAAP
jgi:hypothetical protein